MYTAQDEINDLEGLLKRMLVEMSPPNTPSRKARLEYTIEFHSVNKRIFELKLLLLELT